MKILGDLKPTKAWIDYSSKSLLTTCPRKYFWRVKCGLTENKESLALITGKAIHDGIAAFHESRMKGKTPEECKADAFMIASNVMHEIQSPDDTHNTTHTINVLDLYFDRWQQSHDQCKMVEIGFAVDLDNLVYVGKIDGIHQTDFGLMVRETKTTTVLGERWGMRTKPNSQIDGYVAAYYINTGEMPAGAILDVVPLKFKAKTKGGGIEEPFRHHTMRTLQDVDDWLEDTKEWFNTLAFHENNGIWPKNTDACYPLLGFSCEYPTLCNMHPSVKGLDPNMTEIPEAYKFDAWQPWEIPSVVAK